jgi:hypothetical protein
MARTHDIGDCEHCKKKFGYYLIHNGFNDSAYAYCDTCGSTALLDGLESSEGHPDAVASGHHARGRASSRTVSVRRFF